MRKACFSVRVAGCLCSGVHSGDSIGGGGGGGCGLWGRDLFFYSQRRATVSWLRDVGLHEGRCRRVELWNGGICGRRHPQRGRGSDPLSLKRRRRRTNASSAAAAAQNQVTAPLSLSLSLLFSVLSLEWRTAGAGRGIAQNMVNCPEHGELRCHPIVNVGADPPFRHARVRCASFLIYVDLYICSSQPPPLSNSHTTS